MEEETAGTVPLPYFNRRIKLLVEVLDQPDEIVLATQLLRERGWAVRQATPADSPSARSGFTALIVEVRLRGARLGACRHARSQVRSLIEQRKLAAWVRDASIVEPDLPRVSTTYHVHRRTPPGAGGLKRWVLKHWEASGGADIQRALVLPGPSDSQKARAEFAQRTLGGPPFDAEIHDVRLGAAPKEEAADVAGRTGGLQTRNSREVATFLGLVVVLLGSGIAIHATESPWALFGLIPAAGLCWRLGAWATSNEPRPVLFRLAIGILFTGALTWLGYLLARSALGPVPILVLVAALTGLGIGLAFGVWHALSHSWISRNISWLLPALIPPLAFVLPIAGRFLHTYYLREKFGIPADTVPIAFYSQYFVAMKPMAIASAIVFIFLGIIGWVRHFHWGGGARELTLMMWPFVLLVYLLTAVQVSLGDTSDAAERTAARARAGDAPGSYYGIVGSLVCVQPLGKDIPVLNGPLPRNHPVLSFGSTGDYLWVWDPKRDGRIGQAVRVRSEDVAVLTFTDRSDRRCPRRATDGS
ncbi:hypothetical protein [Streptomyces nanshensis]|uniref:hypothetical protein n=1 Tax=Streptomyces nanshensis TaxID=518642 RepID=UPI00114D1BEA|nr:hypothetical protein [Streptomyces nanshensis]